MKTFIFKIIGLIFITTIISSCSTIKQSRGYVPDEKVIGAIRVETDNKDSVMQMLGSPTMRPTFDDNNWYYYSKETERWAFFREEVVKMDILAISFSEDDYVSDIRRYTVEDNIVIDPVSKKTVTHGKDVNFFAELFGNVGRFGSAGGRPEAGN